MKESCEVCGQPGATMQLTRWVPAGKSEFVYEAVWRCKDRVACRDRVEAKGEVFWPLDPDPSRTPREVG